MTAYDDVIYPGRAYADTHPDRLASIATLFGMTPAPPQRCRMLEVACGDGANLIGLAYALPDSRFFGFDLAQRPVEAGQRLAARTPLANLSLGQCDLTDFPADAGEFDYIVAHGLYSWIPAPLRDRLLALIARHLAPNGVAFVSYNTYPGCYVRRMLWEMLKFHVAELTDSQSILQETHAFLRLMASGAAAPNSPAALLDGEVQRLRERDAGALFHDDLAQVNEPIYFHQFTEHAAQHDLQFLAEAELAAMGPVGLAPEAWSVLEKLDLLTREQYLDFLKYRRFRQTLLCHRAVTLDRSMPPQLMRRFLLTAQKRVQVGDLTSTASGADAVPDTSQLGDAATLQAMLDRLHAVLPGWLRLEELLESLPGPSRPSSSDAAERLVRGAVRLGVMQFRSYLPRLATRPGERPVASRLARVQAEDGELVINLLHEMVKLDDDVVRALVQLLDGTRDRAQLLDALGERLPGDAGERTRALETHLDRLAKIALLTD